MFGIPQVVAAPNAEAPETKKRKRVCLLPFQTFSPGHALSFNANPMLKALTALHPQAPHDKNAPKRPVTPYFLYMQTMRGEIANEMPPGHTAKQVNEEGTRRWVNMPEAEKKVSLIVW